MPRLDYHGAASAAPSRHDEGLAQEWAMLLLHEVNLLRRAHSLPERTLTDLAAATAQLRAQRQAAQEHTV